MKYNPEKPQECLTEFDKVKTYELVSTIIFLGLAVFFLVMSLQGNFR